MAVNSFDVVSRIDLQEVSNAVQQVSKELRTRYDLKNTKSEVDLDQIKFKIILKTPDEFTLRAVREILEQKLIRRGIPVRSLTFGKLQPAAGSSVVQEVEMQQGIPVEKGREIVKLVKGTKRKVQASIQSDQVRISGKKRDDLQAVMAALKEHDFGIHMEFTNYRSS
ncbi:MAG: YajQ family cyclic di-GMP-binding protein [Solibacterales bacterium]|nr:YajQ family cyclic di-GMP-binding protein [Bryobacterales bacterium]